MSDMDQAYARMASALFDETKRQQGEVATLIRRLGAAVGALEKSTAELPATVAHQVKGELSAAARHAATEIASNWTEANKHAELATKAYRQETIWGPRRIMLINLVAIVVGVAAMLIVARFLVPDEKYLAQLRAEQAQLEENIRRLDARGAKGHFSTCKDAKGKIRTCVQIDESQRFEDGYWIIR
jgi:hypothetical protein